MAGSSEDASPSLFSSLSSIFFLYVWLKRMGGSFLNTGCIGK